MLELVLGRQAVTIRQFAHGIDERPLVPAREPQKTYSHPWLSPQSWTMLIVRLSDGTEFAAVH